MFRLALALCAFCPALVRATTYYVAPTGSDSNPGTTTQPFLTVNKGAQVAVAGDIVEVRSGTYRERVYPKNSGTAAQPITYRVASGATVYLKGTEATGYGTSYTWTLNADGTYQVTLPNGFFTAVNPFDPTTSALLNKTSRTLGEVYLNATALTEVSTNALVVTTSNSWHATVAGTGDTTIVARFSSNPNNSTNLTEVNARSQIFAPASTENFTLGYIVIDGFRFEGCANQFPDNFYGAGGVPQQGALSTGGGHHWEIKNCIIRNAKTIGLDFGYLGNDLFLAFLSAHGYSGTVGGVFYSMGYYGLGSLGYHNIHDNRVAQCGSCGIAGMWGCYTSIRHNVVEYNNRLNFVAGYEQGGLKTHQFTGGVVQDNLFRNNKYAALWLDLVDDGVRVHGNVFVDNDLGLMLEVGWGPVLVDGNVFIKSPLLHSHSGGAILAQNLFVDCTKPSLQFSASPVRTSIVNLPHVDDRRGVFGLTAHVRENKYYNNLWLTRGLSFPTGNNGIYNNVARWNFFAVNSSAADIEGTDYVDSPTAPAYSYTSTGSGVTLQFTLGSAPTVTGAQPIGLAVAGLNQVNGWDLPDADRSFDWQTWGTTPPAGPLTTLAAGTNSLTLWPKTANPAIAPGATVAYRNDTFVVSTSDTLTYTGSWTARAVIVDLPSRDASFGHLGGNYHYSTSSTAKIETTFTGTRFLVIGAQDASGGDVDVYVDGSVVATFNTTGATSTPQTTLYDSGVLSSGTHTIKLQKIDTGKFNFDAFELFP